jgi:hypothetical protein
MVNLWTVWTEYFATGEGHSIMACIIYAENESGAKKKFDEKFGEHFGMGAQASLGVIENALTSRLFTQTTFEEIRGRELKCNIDAYASLHFNFS